MADSKFEKEFKKLGQRCKELRLARGLTQEDMVDFGFSTRFYQRIEAGKPIHLRTVFKLAKCFKVPTASLFEHS